MPPQIRSDAESTTRDMPTDGPLATHEGHVASRIPADEAAHEQPEAEALAEAIKRVGMAGPAAIALRIAEPLAWIGGQMLWAVQPLLQGLGIGSRRDASGEAIPRLARFLEGEGNVTELITRLEAGAEKKVKAKSRHSTGSEHGPV